MNTENNLQNETSQQMKLLCLSYLTEMLWNTPTAVVTVGQSDEEGPLYQEREITPIDVCAAMNAAVCNVWKMEDAPGSVMEMIRGMWNGNPFAKLDDILAAEETRLIFLGLNTIDSKAKPAKCGAWYLCYSV